MTLLGKARPKPRFLGNVLGLFFGRCQGHTHKGHSENVLVIMTFRVFSRYFQGIFRVLRRRFQGVFQGIYPMPFLGMPLCPSNKEKNAIVFFVPFWGGASNLDDRQITRLISVRLKHFLYDFWGVFGASFLLFFFYKRPKTPPQKVI